VTQELAAARALRDLSTSGLSSLALKAAALEATGIAFEIREAAGPVAFANARGRACFHDAPADAPDH